MYVQKVELRTGKIAVVKRLADRRIMQILLQREGYRGMEQVRRTNVTINKRAYGNQWQQGTGAGNKQWGITTSPSQTCLQKRESNRHHMCVGNQKVGWH